MQWPNRLSKCSAWIAGASLTALFAGGVASADGPVGPGSLPGGVSVLDSDSGSGEQWGRAGGREQQFNILTPSNFTSLTWGAVGTNAVSLAFDGTANASETLALNFAASDLVNGVAVWSGNAELPLSGFPALMLQTRFTLTVVDGSSLPVTLTSVPGGNEPGLDVLAAASTFRATLLFEANHNGSFGIPAGWTPVLDLFDDPRLPTIAGNVPGTTGPVLTSFNSGFFFDVLAGLTLSEHDDNMFTQTNMIKGELAFLTTDAINRLAQLATGQQEIHDWVNNNHAAAIDAINMLAASIPEIPEFPPLPPDIASSEDVQQAQDELSNILLILFGLAPCPSGAPCTEGELIKLFASPEDLERVQADIQSLLAKVTEIQEASSQEIDVQVVDTSNDSLGKFHRWLITTTINGEPIDASLVRGVAVHVRRRDAAAQNDVTMLMMPVSLGPGLLDVSLELPSHLRNASAFQLDFFFDDGTTVARGTALVTANPRR